MKKAKSILIKLPEYYLVLLLILSGYTPPFSFNPIIVGLVAILILQIVFKNKISGLIIAGIFLVINLFMLFALFSEFNEFLVFSSGAKQLLFGGLSIWIINIFFMVLMIYKYIKPENESSPRGIGVRSL